MPSSKNHVEEPTYDNMGVEKAVVSQKPILYRLGTHSYTIKNLSVCILISHFLQVHHVMQHPPKAVTGIVTSGPIDYWPVHSLRRDLYNICQLPLSYTRKYKLD